MTYHYGAFIYRHHISSGNKPIYDIEILKADTMTVPKRYNDRDNIYSHYKCSCNNITLGVLCKWLKADIKKHQFNLQIDEGVSVPIRGPTFFTNIIADIDAVKFIINREFAYHLNASRDKPFEVSIGMSKSMPQYTPRTLVSRKDTNNHHARNVPGISKQNRSNHIAQKKYNKSSVQTY